MATGPLSDTDFQSLLAAISREVQAEVNYKHYQLGTQVELLKERVAYLERLLDLSGLNEGMHDSSVTGFSAAPTASKRESSYIPLAPQASRSMELSGRKEEEETMSREMTASRSLQRYEVELEGEEILSELPESMYNYCMQCLSVSPQPLHDPAMLHWLTLFFLQFVIMTAFVVYTDVLNNAIGVLPPVHRERSITTCLFSKASISHTPIIQYCIGFGAMLLLASEVRSNDDDTLVASYPQQDHSRTFHCFVRFAWFWQAVYMPGCFVLEAATMFAGSPDALTVVMNSLAVSYIMEIDNRLYASFLSVEEKIRYQRCVGCEHEKKRPAGVHRCTWLMFLLNITLMVIQFTGILMVLGEGSLYGDNYVTGYWIAVFPLYCSSYALRFILQYLYTNNITVRDFLFCRSTDNSVHKNVILFTLAVQLGGFATYHISYFCTTLQLGRVGFTALEYAACDQGRSPNAFGLIGDQSEGSDM